MDQNVILYVFFLHHFIVCSRLTPSHGTRRREVAGMVVVVCLFGKSILIVIPRLPLEEERLKNSSIQPETFNRFYLHCVVDRSLSHHIWEVQLSKRDQR